MSSRSAKASLGVVLVAVALAGCREKAPAPSPGARHYAVRAEVVRLPDPARPAGELLLRHEAVPDLADASGKVVGMASMVMPFHVERAALPTGLAVGDPVLLRFSVDFAAPAFRVEQLTKLPAGTQLRF